MTTTVFTDHVTPVPASWLNDVNGATYNGSAVYTPAGTGAVATTEQNELRKTITLNGYVADGVTDDSAAINAVTLYASTLATAFNAYVTVIFPPGNYRIAQPLIARSYVRCIGYGVTLTGPISGYGRITAGTAIPAASNVVDQTSGGCWTDSSPTTNPADVSSGTSGAMWEGFTLYNFRYGFASRLFAWVYPHILNCTFISCDAACVAFNGSQMWTIENPTTNQCGTLFIGAAGAYTSGNPLSSASWTGYFCDGLTIKGKGQTACDIVKLSDFDAWFSDSILRPTTSSVVAGFTGNFPLATATPSALATSAQCPSGRLFYVPQRNDRLTFDFCINNMHVIRAPRGYGLVSNPANCTIKHLRGEGMLMDGALTSECGVVIGLSNGSQITGSIEGVDTAYVTGTTYDSVVGFADDGSSGITRMVLRGITGKFNRSYLNYCSYVEVLDGDPLNIGYSIRKNAWVAQYNPIIPINGSLYIITVNGGPGERNYDTGSGLSYLKRSVNGVLPRVGNTETQVQLIFPINGFNLGDAEPIQGKLKLLVRRLDTGVQDYGEFLISWAGQNSSSTLTSNVSAAATSIPVAVGIYFGAGSVITIGGTDRYVVKNFSGNTVNLETPLRSGYSSGAAVATVNGTDATIHALSGGIASVSWSGTSLCINNSIGAGTPIEFRAEFEYFGSPPQ